MKQPSWNWKQTEPFVDALANLILGKSIAFLDFAFELVTSAVYCSKVVIVSLPHFSLTLP